MGDKQSTSYRVQLVRVKQTQNMLTTTEIIPECGKKCTIYTNKNDNVLTFCRVQSANLTVSCCAKLNDIILLEVNN